MIPTFVIFIIILCEYATKASNCCIYQHNTLDLRSCVLNELAWMPDETPGMGPTFDLGIIFYSTEGISDYASYSLAVTMEYAKHHGYHLLAYNESTGNFDGNDHRWNKVRLLYEAIHPVTGIARYWDYIVWVDADLIVLDFELNLDHIISSSVHTHGLYNKGHLWFSAEHAGSSTRVNSGMVIVRNSVWSYNFLVAWWKFADRRVYSDQEQFDLLYSALLSLASGADNAESLVSRHQDNEVEELLLKLVPSTRLRSVSAATSLPQIVILPPHALNSDPPAMVKQRPDHAVLHLMGENSAFRVRTFSTAFANICAAYRGSISDADEDQSREAAIVPDIVDPALIPPQLGLSQLQLLKWTIECYHAESVALMAAFKERLGRGIASSTVEARLLSNSVHHFAHAMEYISELHWNSTLYLSNWSGAKDEAPSTEVLSDYLDIDSVDGTTSNSLADIAPVLNLFDHSALLSMGVSNGTTCRTTSNGNCLDTGSLRRDVSHDLSTHRLLYEHLLISFRMRTDLYSLLKQNSVLRRKQIRADAVKLNSGGGIGPCTGVSSSDLELLKATAEAGQNLIHINYYATLSIREKLKVADEIYQLLSVDIKQCCHKQQFQALDIMISQLHVDIGVMLFNNNYIDSEVHGFLRRHMGALFENDGDADSAGGLSMNATSCFKLALRHFRESVRILDTVTEMSTNQRSVWQNMGSHILVQPLLWVIKTLEKLGYGMEASAEQKRLAAVLAY